MYLGDQCATNIIINDILKRKKKLLFMLGAFRFDNIVQFLEENKWEEIYDKKFLKPCNNSNVSLIFENTVNKNTHLFDLDNCIRNTKYNFNFHHDFLYDKHTNKILNYQFIVNQYNVKIKNTRELFTNDKPVIFINFVFAHDMMKQLIPSNLNRMISVLKKQIPHKKFYIFFFTNFHDLHVSCENVHFIYLQNNYVEWSHKTPKQNFELYKEIYNKFYETTKKIGLQSHFTTFDKTPYFIENNSS
jgi:hypothetical protein